MSGEASGTDTLTLAPREQSDAIEAIPFAFFLIDSNLEFAGANAAFWTMLAAESDRNDYSLADLEEALHVKIEPACHRLLNAGDSQQEIIGAGAPDSGTSPLMICLAPTGQCWETGVMGLLIRSTGESKTSPQGPAGTNTGSILSNLTHQLAHELRNPCTIIGGFAALLKRNLNSADKLSEYARIIMEEVQRVEKTLDDVLSFSKSLLDTRAMVDLNELVTEAVESGVADVFASAGAIEVCRNENVLPALVNREQAVQSLRDILAVMRSALPDEVGIRLKLKESGRHNCIEIGFVVEESDRAKTEQRLAALFSSGSRATGLRLTLAIESIRHSGGEFELIGTSSSCTRVCIAYPATEETYA